MFKKMLAKTTQISIFSGKKHSCDLCKKPILKGQTYVRATAFRGGTSAHLDCLLDFCENDQLGTAPFKS